MGFIIKKILDIKQNFHHEGFKKYFKNASWNFFNRFINLIIGFFVTAYMARYLGPSNYGLLSYAVSFAGIFSFIASLGIDQIVYRDLIKYPEKKDRLLGTAFFLKLIGGVMTFLVTLITTRIVNQDPITNVLILIIAFSYIFQSFNVINAFFQSKVLSKYPSIISVITVLFLSLTKLLLIFFQKGIIYFATIYILEVLLYALGYIFIYKINKQRLLNWQFNFPLAKKILHDSWPLLLVNAMAFIYTRIDQVMVKNYLDQTAVGYYSVAVRIAEVWYFIPTMITTSLLPAIINAKKINLSIYKKRLSDLFVLILIISFSISFPIFILAKPIIIILFGNIYSPAIIVLQIYVWAGIGLALAEVINQYLIAENFSKVLFYSSAAGMVMNVLLNIIFIPRFGINGAAWATLISYMLIPITVFFILRKKIWKNVL